ncbi:MAG: caspase domain-containing protein [Pseudorhodoplanes sp.]|uniref:caspase family protein n=1 Tax=Pseudorhodoplanes sp. TaxID=1934341 RepID=UPI003D09D826
MPSLLRHYLLRHIAVALAAVFLATPALAERRVALVIGNGAYRHADRLPNPKNDAEDVSAALRRTGFETITGIDLDKAGMEEVTIRFAREARDADVAIFYFSGHAMQFNGVNYLMPVDARLTDEADLRRMARVDEIVADVQQARNLRILVLDSCRDNPLAEQLKRRIGLTRSAAIGRGLARIDSPQGMILAFSTQAGTVAADGSGRNSPYTAAFLKHIEAAEEIGTVFRRVSADVFEATRRAQLPELSLSLIGEFYLRGRPAAVPQVPNADVAKLQEELKTLRDQINNKAEPKVAVVVPPVAPAVPQETEAGGRGVSAIDDNRYAAVVGARVRAQAERHIQGMQHLP